MKRFITITVVLMLMLIFIGCATVPEATPIGTQKTQDLSSSVGNSQFVGDPSMDARKTALGIGMR
jgi:hypothetical protein